MHDGKHGFAKELGRYCGDVFPQIIYSSDRYLWLHFHSDENIEYEGFQAVYEFLPRTTTSTFPASEVLALCRRRRANIVRLHIVKFVMMLMLCICVCACRYVVHQHKHQHRRINTNTERQTFLLAYLYFLPVCCSAALRLDVRVQQIRLRGLCDARGYRQGYHREFANAQAQPRLLVAHRSGGELECEFEMMDAVDYDSDLKMMFEMMDADGRQTR